MQDTTLMKNILLTYNLSSWLNHQRLWTIKIFDDMIGLKCIIVLNNLILSILQVLQRKIYIDCDISDNALHIWFHNTQHFF